MPLEVLFTPLATLAAILFGMLLPGALLALGLAHKVRLAMLEFVLLSFGLGLAFLDGSMLLLGRLHLPLTALALSLWYGALLIPLFCWLRHNKWLSLPPWETIITTQKNLRVTILILILVFFVKGFYLADSILPTTTDLGHHLYWAQTISLNHELPVYQKQEILRDENNHYALSGAETIADFIIGEHLPLAFIAIFTGASYTGVFPFLFLFLLNVLALLAVATLGFRLGQKIIMALEWQRVTAEWFFVVSLFLFGVLFSLASPEMKFVSGGVIGNLFGNFFIPLILLFLLRTLSEENQKKRGFLFTAFLILVTTLAYTHHLSTFVLGYIFVAFGLVLVLFLQKDCIPWFRSQLGIFISKPVLLFFSGLLLFVLFIALPTYLEPTAVSTAVGTPTKDTRTGLSLLQLSASNSPLKVGAAFFALLLIAVVRPLRKSIAGVLLFAWGSVLLIMAMAPQLLWVNIPSNRIAHYTSFPLSLLTLLVLFFLFETWHTWRTTTQDTKNAAKNSSVVQVFVLCFMAFALFFPGLLDNEGTLVQVPKAHLVEQTFGAARYLTEHTSPKDQIIKDHNFIEASDTWMKLFFNRGYNYPFSRSFFKRYEDNPKREQCTLALISTPNTPLGEQCYRELAIRFVIVNPKYDKAQFQKSPDFSLIYHSPDIAIFERLKQ